MLQVTNCSPTKTTIPQIKSKMECYRLQTAHPPRSGPQTLQGHHPQPTCGGWSYPSAETHLAYSTAPANRSIKILISILETCCHSDFSKTGLTNSHRVKIFLNTKEAIKAIELWNRSTRVRTPVALLRSLSGKYPWERYEPPYSPSSYG